MGSQAWCGGQVNENAPKFESWHALIGVCWGVGELGEESYSQVRHLALAGAYGFELVEWLGKLKIIGSCERQVANLAKS